MLARRLHYTHIHVLTHGDVLDEHPEKYGISLGEAVIPGDQFATAISSLRDGRRAPTDGRYCGQLRQWSGGVGHHARGEFRPRSPPVGNSPGHCLAVSPEHGGLSASWRARSIGRC